MSDQQPTHTPNFNQRANEFMAEAFAGGDTADERMLKGLALILAYQGYIYKTQMETREFTKRTSFRLGFLLFLILAGIALQFLGAILALIS